MLGSLLLAASLSSSPLTAVSIAALTVALTVAVTAAPFLVGRPKVVLRLARVAMKAQVSRVASGTISAPPILALRLLAKRRVALRATRPLIAPVARLSRVPSKGLKGLATRPSVTEASAVRLLAVQTAMGATVQLGA